MARPRLVNMTRNTTQSTASSTVVPTQRAASPGQTIADSLKAPSSMNTVASTSDGQSARNMTWANVAAASRNITAVLPPLVTTSRSTLANTRQPAVLDKSAWPALGDATQHREPVPRSEARIQILNVDASPGSGDAMRDRTPDIYAAIKKSESSAQGNQVVNADLPDFNDMSNTERLLWALANDGLLLALDVERFLRQPANFPKDAQNMTISVDAFTEVGISVSDPFDLSEKDRQNVSKRILNIYGRHIRIKELAHLINRSRGHYWPVCYRGCEGCFQFGLTEFASDHETKQIIREMLLVYRDDSDTSLGYRPVALLLYAAKRSKKWFDEFGINLDEPEFGHVFVVDTQVVARRRHDGGEISLHDLLADSDISNDHAHNSGNDAFRTLVCGLIDGLRKLHLQPRAYQPSEADSRDDSTIISNSESTGTNTTSVTSISSSASGFSGLTIDAPPRYLLTPAEAVKQVRDTCNGIHQFRHARTKGVVRFCNRCRSLSHLRDECRARVECERCGRKEHMTDMCIRMHDKRCRLDGNCHPNCWSP